MSTRKFWVIDYQEIRKIMKFEIRKLGVVITFQQLLYGNWSENGACPHFLV